MSCDHPSENSARPVGKTDRQLTDLPTPTRRKNRHDKDRMIYLTKREIEKEFHTPRFAKGGQRLWCLASRGNHRLGNRYDGGPTGKMAQRLWLAAASQSLPPQRAHWHFAGNAGKCHSGSDAFQSICVPHPQQNRTQERSRLSAKSIGLWCAMSATVKMPSRCGNGTTNARTKCTPTRMCCWNTATTM